MSIKQIVLGIADPENKSKHKLLHKFPLSKSTVYLIFFFGLNCKSTINQKKDISNAEKLRLLK